MMSTDTIAHIAGLFEERGVLHVNKRKLNVKIVGEKYIINGISAVK